MMKYYFLQFKRMLKVLPYIFGAAVVLVAGLLLVFHSVIDSSAQEDSVRFRLAIVGSAEDGYLKKGLEIVQAYDSARFAVETVQMEENEARRALEKGQIGAYVVIPEGYIQDAMSGHIGSLKYVSTVGAADLSTLFKDEITSVVADIIIACEQAMYGAEAALSEQELYNKINPFIYDISLTYVDYVLDRNDMYHIESLGIRDSLGLEGYLFSGITILLFSLLLIPAAGVFIKNEHAFEKVLKSKGIGAFGQVIGEFGALFSAYGILVLVFIVALTLFSEGISSELSRLTAMLTLPNTLVVLSVVFVLSTLSYLLFQLADNIVSGVLAQFAAVLVLCFLSGCLYPLYFFPDRIQRMAVIFPQYYCRSVLASSITGEVSYLPVVILGAYGLILLLTAGFIRNLRLRKGQW